MEEEEEEGKEKEKRTRFFFYQYEQLTRAHVHFPACSQLERDVHRGCAFRVLAWRAHIHKHSLILSNWRCRSLHFGKTVWRRRGGGEHIRTVLDDTLDVTVLFGVILVTEFGRAHTVVCVGLEDATGTFTLSTDDSTHLIWGEGKSKLA